MGRAWSFSRTGGYRERKDMTCRSSYEARVKKHLKEKEVRFTYETLKIPYTITHTYKPDFILSNGIIVEAKGLFLPEDRTKHLKVKEQHPTLDIRFLFMKDQRISRGSKTKYSDWCKKHGFKYAIGEHIPQAWIEEGT